jgi:hypothetical protein
VYLRAYDSVSEAHRLAQRAPTTSLES